MVRRVEIKEGMTLWQALMEKGIEIDRPCAGNGTCKGCRVNVEGIGTVQSCEFNQPGEYEVEIPDGARFDIVGSKAPEVNTGLSQKKDIAVIDVGTTTVAMRRIRGGKIQDIGFINPQRSYGADVMSRINKANYGDAEVLQSVLWDAINANIDEQGGQTEFIISANTTMQHIMRGLSCKSLGTAPFEPVDISLYIEDNITYLPGISTFVGADIVSGLYYLDILSAEKPVLFIDLGTNGEMALGCRDKLIVTSAAAGPAFEGSDIALELHASGLMRLLRALLEAGAMDEYGTLIDPYFDTGYRTSEGLILTQDHIRELQMAKAAVRAGIEILLKKYGITAAQVDKVYLAGGMGYYLDPEDAIAIGLLPDGMTDIEAVGNTSLAGAWKYMETRDSEALARIIASAKEVILSNDPAFEELYIEKMNF